MKFTFSRDPYGEGENLRKKKSFDIEPGLTVLVGCNGAGKTTLLKNIRDYCKKNDIPYLFYNSIEKTSRHDVMRTAEDISFIASMFTASEGEGTMIKLSDFAYDCGRLMKSSKDAKDVFILVDSLGSGFSIDGVLNIKEHLFSAILQSNTEERRVYLLVSANEYSLVEGENCFDVQECHYRKFSTYKTFKNFVLKSREKRNRIGR